MDKKKVKPRSLKDVLITQHKKIIAVTIPSRHKRGKTKKYYKVFLDYDPNIEGVNSIKSNFLNNFFQFKSKYLLISKIDKIIFVAVNLA